MPTEQAHTHPLTHTKMMETTNNESKRKRKRRNWENKYI